MPAPVILLASLVAFSDEHVKPPVVAHEQCVELRQFRANGGCRVAVDPSIAWLCLGDLAGGTYGVRFKSAEGALVKEYSYSKRQSDNWEGHFEIFYTSSDRKKNPDLRIGLADQKDGTVVVAKSRLCIPAESTQAIKR